MGLLGFIKGKAGSEHCAARQQIEGVIEITKVDCDGCLEGGERDLAVFEKMKLDRETQLFGSSTPASIHFVVPTSQEDWAHSACDEKKGSIQSRVSKWADARSSSLGDKIEMRTNVSSLPMNILDLEVMKGEKNDVLIFPHFVRLVGLRAENVDEVLDEILPLLLVNDVPALLARDDVAACPEDSFVFLCSHTTRDKRCGITAPILRKHFFKQLQSHGLYRDISDFRPHGCNVAYVNHVGGHKFAANVLIYLKRSHVMIWLGRVSPLHVKPIVDHVLIPDVPKLPFPENVRCIKQYEF